MTGNNLNLQVPTNAASCPFIPLWETSEGFDYGEGSHLAAVHNSRVINNIVDHNAGGILLTDETGPNHDNLITGNTVTDNGYDCGITLVSHRPAVSHGFGTDPARAFGAYRNTVVGNEASRNGLLVSGNGTGSGSSPLPDFRWLRQRHRARVDRYRGQHISADQHSSKQFDDGAVGVTNFGSGTVDATMNWWGCSGGPASRFSSRARKRPWSVMRSKVIPRSKATSPTRPG